MVGGCGVDPLSHPGTGFTDPMRQPAAFPTQNWSPAPVSIRIIAHTKGECAAGARGNGGAREFRTPCREAQSA